MTRALLELEGTLLDGAARGATMGLTLAERHARLLGLARRQGDDELLARAARLTGDRARAERRALDGADVVVTTFARLAAREELAEQRFRSVVIDEAGAAPLPYVLFASCLASDRAAAFGDFQQLPPVVMSRGPAARRWLSRDLFRQADVVAADGGGLPSDGDRLCALLDRQYRMRPPIRALVSDLFYGGRLSDAPEVEERPGVPGGIVLVDTGSLVPAVERTDGSRENAAHLEVLLQALELLARSGLDDVAVVTPYRAQSRRLARLARDRLGRAAPQALEISTIHRFQGREKSVVILDTVDAPPDRSWFLDERRNPEFPRLLNVALSRSRDLLLVVATPEGLARTLPPEALLNRVVARIAADGRVVDGGRMHELLHLVRGPGR
jgi:superfamily I DNA and/or RNA helicase